MLIVITLMLTLMVIFRNNNEIFTWMVLILPVYFIAGMMRFYQQKFWKILLKFFMVFGIYSLLLIVTLGLLSYLAILQI